MSGLYASIFNQGDTMTSIKKNRSASDWFGYVVGQAGNLFLRTWFLMLFIGALHAEWFPQIPALSFWAVFVGLVAFDLIVESAISSGVKSALREELA